MIPKENELPGKAFKKQRATLLKERQKRKQPHLDDKVLTAWNGMMIAALSKGYQVLGNETYLKAAQKAAGLLKRNGDLHRSWRNGKTSGAGVLNDYAYLIDGLLELYQSDFNSEWFEWAVSLQKIQDELFWDRKNGGYFIDNGKDSTLIQRAKTYDDSAIPAGNSVAALNLLRLADFTHDESYKKKAVQLFELAGARVNQVPSGYAQLLMALEYHLSASKEVVVAGSTKELLSELYNPFLPNIVISIADESKPMIDGKPTIYVCENGSCQLPVHNIDEALKQIQ